MRRLSRRELLGLGAAAGVVAVSGTSAGALPARGGSLRLGLTGGGLRAFDGRRPFDPVMRVAGHGAVFDCLTEIGADGAIRGELASRWEASPDARVWHIALREDAAFHDGRPFGADDAVSTLRLHRTGASAVAGRIASVRRAGPHEIVVVLRYGDPALPFLLSDPQLIMLPAADPEAAMGRGIGTGLYRMDPEPVRERAVLRRVERHWKDGHAGWFERVEILTLPDPRARLEALKSGRVDAVNMADAAWAAEARRHGRIALAEVRGPAFVEVAVEGLPPERARAVAGALARTVDRAAIVAALGGQGRPAEVPPGEPEAVSGVVSIRIAPERVPGAAALAEALRGAARRAGLTVTDAAEARVVARLRPGRPTPDWTPTPAREAAFVAVHANGLFAHSTRLHHGPQIGALWDLDSGRIAERWWYA